MNRVVGWDWARRHCGVMKFETRYRAFYLRHVKLRRFLPAWKVYVR